MKKRAFTLLELIFVIVIIGVLSGVGFYNFKPHYLRNDINFVLMKLEQARYTAIGYDKSHPTSSSYIGCVTIDDLNKTDDPAYTFHSALQNKPFNLLCFDTLGKAHKNDENTTLNSLFSQDITLIYQYNAQETNITIDHLSGDIRIFR